MEPFPFYFYYYPPPPLNVTAEFCFINFFVVVYICTDIGERI